MNKEMYVTELHLHTKESSSCSEITAKEIIEAYKEQGYHTIVVTDHCSKSKFDKLGKLPWKQKIDYVCQGYEKALEAGTKLGLNILFSIELTLVSTHSDYLVYGIDQSFLYKHKELYHYSLEELSEICKENNFLLIQAHPFRENIQLAPLEYIDGIEVFNGCQNEISRNEKALAYGKNTNKILTSGSDFHRIEDLAKGGIRTDNEIKNREQLIETLRSKKFKIKKETD